MKRASQAFLGLVALSVPVVTLTGQTAVGRSGLVGERGQGARLSGVFHAIAACNRSARLNMITHWMNA